MLNKLSRKKIVFVGLAGAMMLAACAAPPAAPIATSAPAATVAPTEVPVPTEAPTVAPTAAIAAKDIVDTAVEAGTFNTLAAALTAAGLVETLKGEGPFTVFAPTDEAFAKLDPALLQDLLKPENKDRLTAILTYHVVPGKVMAADVTALSSAKTVQGEEITIKVDGSTVMVDGANVTATDIEASNGVIHVIDAVILPPTIAAAMTASTAMTTTAEMTSTAMMTDTSAMTGTMTAEIDIVDMAQNAGFSTLVAAVQAAGLEETLRGEGPFTVFAPTDEAFAKLPKETLDNLLKPENKDQLVKVLTYHVVPGRVLAADVVKLTSAKTVEGQDIAIKVDGDKVMVNNATVTSTNIATKNGVIHIIDMVILPPDMQ